MKITLLAVYHTPYNDHSELRQNYTSSGLYHCCVWYKLTIFDWLSFRICTAL